MSRSPQSSQPLAATRGMQAWCRRASGPNETPQSKPAYFHCKAAHAPTSSGPWTHTRKANHAWYGLSGQDTLQSRHGGQEPPSPDQATAGLEPRKAKIVLLSGLMRKPTSLQNWTAQSIKAWRWSGVHANSVTSSAYWRLDTRVPSDRAGPRVGQ